MVSWKLGEEQQQALDALRVSTTDARIVRNATVILLSGQGRSKEWLTQELELSMGTVNNIRRGYRLRGLAGLKPLPRPGRRSRATAEYRALLRQAAQTPPQSLGYRFRIWSARRLALHLEQSTGIWFGEDQMRRLLRKEGFTTLRPSRPIAPVRVRVNRLTHDYARPDLGPRAAF